MFSSNALVWFLALPTMVSNANLYKAMAYSSAGFKYGGLVSSFACKCYKQMLKGNVNITGIGSLMLLNMMPRRVLIFMQMRSSFVKLTADF